MHKIKVFMAESSHVLYMLQRVSNRFVFMLLLLKGNSKQHKIFSAFIVVLLCTYTII